MKMTGAKILIESLKKEGVEIIFGYPGGQVLPVGGGGAVDELELGPATVELPPGVEAEAGPTGLKDGPRAALEIEANDATTRHDLLALLSFPWVRPN